MSFLEFLWNLPHLEDHLGDEWLQAPFNNHRFGHEISSLDSFPIYSSHWSRNLICKWCHSWGVLTIQSKQFPQRSGSRSQEFSNMNFLRKDLFLEASRWRRRGEWSDLDDIPLPLQSWSLLLQSIFFIGNMIKKIIMFVIVHPPIHKII